MNNISEYKIKQLKMFFRFLKEYGEYENVINTFKEKYILLKTYNTYFSEKHFGFESYVKTYLYCYGPSQFFHTLKMIARKHEDMLVLENLWLLEIMKHKRNPIFDSTDIIDCKRKLRKLKHII